MPVTVAPDRVPARRRGRIRVSAATAVVAALVAGAVVIATTDGDGASRAHRARTHRPVPVEVLGEQVTRTPSVPASAPPIDSSTTTAPTTTTTVLPVTPVTPVATAPPALTTTCADAIAYLEVNQAPGFTDICADGSAFGHLGVTCVNAAGMCPGTRFVHIACPVPFVYMNEAHNSWVLTGSRTGIDPYGQGTAAQRAACASHR